jgi:adenine-specific DNA-methyltransferase
MEHINRSFSKLSIELTNLLDIQIKKKNGIYFTPFESIEKSYNIINNYIKNNNINIRYILEPSCGSCEFIKYIDNKFEDINIIGIELNTEIYDKIQDLNFKNNVELINENFLLYKNEHKYDLIIGNPPYYVLKKKEVDEIYYKYFEGRPNIFILFIIKSLSLLSKNGILTFVLPENFLNCLYYNKLRKYINNNYTIISISSTNDKYLDTSQKTILFIICNNKNNIILKEEENEHNFVLTKDNYIIFNTLDNIQKIKELYISSTTLKREGFIVSVGKVVWNQVKDKLTDDKTKTRLIYSGDISNNKLELTKFKNSYKKNYIDMVGKNKQVILINRGYGVGSYKFNYCIIDVDFDYVVENHLLIIEYTKIIEKKDLIIKLNNIIKSLDNKKCLDFIKLYFKNNAINVNEIENILPIYF